MNKDADKWVMKRANYPCEFTDEDGLMRGEIELALREAMQWAYADAAKVIAEHTPKPFTTNSICERAMLTQAIEARANG